MTSAILYGAIDETYPVAGQDNNSQGFRDNFSAIKAGLQQAAGEITDLQTNTPRTDDASDFNGNTITNAVTNRVDGSVYKATPDGAETLVDPDAGDYQQFTFINNHTLKFDFVNADERYAKMRIELRTDGLDSYTISFTAVRGGEIQVESSFPDNYTLDNDSTKIKILEVWTTDGGATIFLKDLGEYTLKGTW